jgi:rRNA-processing protein FCF1
VISIEDFLKFANAQKILPINVDNATKIAFEKMGIPSEVINQLFLLTLPPETYKTYDKHYDLIKSDTFYGDVPFSFDDFLLCYLAAENNFGIVSFDHHILRHIQKYLYYEAFWPEDIFDFPGDSILLLDTNILFTFLKHPSVKQQDLDQVKKMFAQNPSITFLIPEHIIEELLRVYERENKKLNEQKKPNAPEKSTDKKNLSTKEISEKDLGEFIDDYEGFESFNKSRRNDKIKKISDRRGSRSRKSPSHRFTSKKFRSLMDKLEKD